MDSGEGGALRARLPRLRELAEFYAVPMAVLLGESDGDAPPGGRPPKVVLDLERLDRAILRARAAGEGTNELARERETVREAYRQVVSRMEGTL